MLKLEVSIVVGRSVEVVWDFYAVHHVENHPRWDPDLELDHPSGEPIGVGTVITRRSTRFETPTEGTMKIVEFEPGRIMRVETRDGPMTINGWALFADAGEGMTELTIGGEFPGVDESMADAIRPLMQRSATTIKQLIEDET